jgi:hypothetical protein
LYGHRLFAAFGDGAIKQIGNFGVNPAVSFRKYGRHHDKAEFGDREPGQLHSTSASVGTGLRQNASTGQQLHTSAQ